MAPVEIQVEVVWAPAPHQIESRQLSLAAGATAMEALRASALTLTLTHDATLLESLQIGIWGRACRPETRLRDGDRVELYRPLQVDPKEARRQRQRQDGVKKKAPPNKARPR